MDVVIRTRHIEVSDRFRAHVEEKVARLEKHDHRIIRLEVEVDKEQNPRLAERAVRVQLTALSKGPVVRAECSAADKMSALDGAVDKMAGQMRKVADRKRVHRGAVRRCRSAPPRPACPSTPRRCRWTSTATSRTTSTWSARSR